MALEAEDRDPSRRKKISLVKFMQVSAHFDVAVIRCRGEASAP